jgi:hypothetical protein
MIDTKTTKPTIVLPEFSVFAKDPWNRVSWAQILPILVARITAQGYTVKKEEPKDE